MKEKKKELTQGNKGENKCSNNQSLSSLYFAIAVLPLWEVLPGELLPLSQGVVGTDVSRGDGEGA